MKSAVSTAILMLLISASAVISVTAQAAEISDDCSSKNLISSLPSTPKNQGSTEWCAAHSAADLLEQKLGIQISAADLAVRFLKKNPQLIRNKSVFSSGGITDQIIDEIAASEGVCSEQNFHSTVGNLSSLSYLNSFVQGRADQEVSPEKSVTVLSEIFPKVEPRILLRFLERYRSYPKESRKTEELELSLINIACKDRIAIPKTKTENIFCGDSTCPKMTEQIDHALETGNLSSINVSWKKSSTAVENSTLNLHSMTVVGRFRDMMTRECVYVLRDSAWQSRSSNPESMGSLHGAYTHISRENLGKTLRSVTSLVN